MDLRRFCMASASLEMNLEKQELYGSWSISWELVWDL